MNITELIDRYCQAWSEQNEVRRTEMLLSVWALGASYTDPTVHAIGAKELLGHIEKVQKRRPGSTVVRTSVVDTHHNIARFSWCAIEANGNKLPEGLDVAFISDDGSKIERIIGFFGPAKPLQD